MRSSYRTNSSQAGLGNALKSIQYATLVKDYRSKASAMSQKQICPGCGKSSENQKTSNAHSVISRKTLELVFRFGVCEFYAAAMTGLYDRDRVVMRSIDLAGEFTGVKAADFDRKSITESLDLLDKRFAEYVGDMADLDRQAACAADLSDTIQADLHTVLTDPDLSAAHRKAVVAALCTAYRRLILRLATPQPTVAPDLYLRYLLTVTAVSSEAAWKFEAAQGFRTLAGQVDNSQSGAAIRYIDDIGLRWAHEGQVEFGKQCATCEAEQGDADLSRRLIDFVIDRSLVNSAITPDPTVGVVFAPLRPSPGLKHTTVWDLSNAVTCQAIEIFNTSARHSSLATTHAAATFATNLRQRIDALPHLFITYMQVLALELAHGSPMAPGDETRYLVRLLDASSVTLPTEPKPTIERGNDEDLCAFSLFGDETED